MGMPDPPPPRTPPPPACWGPCSFTNPHAGPHPQLTNHRKLRRTQARPCASHLAYPFIHLSFSFLETLPPTPAPTRRPSIPSIPSQNCCFPVLLAQFQGEAFSVPLPTGSALTIRALC